MGQSSLPEKDWKHLSKVKDEAIERIFQQIFQAAQQTLQAKEQSAREKVWNTKTSIDAGIKDLSDAFDYSWSRSKAIWFLRGLINRDALTDEEIAGFSDETREEIKRWRERFIDD